MKSRLLIFLLVFSFIELHGQWFIRNLFVRYQRIEWQKVNLYGGYADLPLKCHPSADARRIWNMAETDLIVNPLRSRKKVLWDKEITLFQACVKIDSGFCDAYYRLAQCLVEMGRWLDAIDVLEKAQRHFPQNALSDLGLGQAYLSMEYPDKALPYFENVKRLLPKSPEGYLGASCALYDLDRKEEARLQIQEAYRVGVTGADAIRLFEGIMIYEQANYQQAFDMLSTITLESKYYYLTPDPEIVGPANYYLGLCLMTGGEEFFDQAERYIRTARTEGVQIDSTVARALGIYTEPGNIKEQLLGYYSRSLVGHYSSNIQQALDYCSQVSPPTELTSPDLTIHAVQCLNLRKKYGDALEILKKGFHKFPGDYNLKLLLERQYLMTDSIDAALQMCLLDLNEKPKNIALVSKAVLMYSLLGKYEQAMSLLKKIEFRFINNRNEIPWQVQMLLGEVLYLKGDLEISIQYLQHAQQFNSINVYLAYYAGLCAGGLEYLSEAKDYFYNAIKLGAIIPSDVRSRYQLVRY